MKDYVWHVKVIEPHSKSFIYSTQEDYELCMRQLGFSKFPMHHEVKDRTVGLLSHGIRVEIRYGKKEEQKAEHKVGEEGIIGKRNRGTVFNGW